MFKSIFPNYYKLCLLTSALSSKLQTKNEKISFTFCLFDQVEPYWGEIALISN